MKIEQEEYVTHLATLVRFSDGQNKQERYSELDAHQKQSQH